ncbi:MAG TPA: hypothetical protein VFD01_17745, partial [Candidatus Dormibacteraeota bacterium]|nr:hypothetical protein [Candidatus Dormibacteraeota bacterium]
MEGVSLTAEERFAEWYVWAKREVSSEGRVCLGAAQAALEALEAGGDERSARLAARRSVAGQAVVLLARVPPRRRAYAEWYDWARRELRLEPARLHAATRAAIECLDRGGSVEEAVRAARAVSEVVPTSAEPATAGGTDAPARPDLATGPAWTPPASVRPSPAPPAPAPPAPTPASPAPTPPAPASPAWSGPSGRVQPPESWLVPATAPAVVSPALGVEAQAGFWRRVVAFLIDAVLATIGVALV